MLSGMVPVVLMIRIGRFELKFRVVESSMMNVR